MKRYGLSRPVMRAVAAAGLLLGLAFAGAASAQQGTINPEQACKEDAFRLCDQFIPDRDKTGACLRRNARSLSRDCRTVVLGGGGGGRRAVHRTYRHRTHHH
jgi:hypothetical protein